jgi:hypothetical protein
MLIATASAGEGIAAELISASRPSGAEGAFPAFCDAWMRKVSARETDNERRIRWQRGPSGVEGEYIGYGEAKGCQVKTGTPTGVPVGKLVYHEYRYRKAGPSAEAAAASRPVVVDVTEITEIFRYANGEWVY